MCGIAGFNWSNKTLIKKMADCLKHRGPDAWGCYSDSHLSLGHRRLSILDLSFKGKQPMKFKHLIIVFNGEIYNFKEIKKELVAKGHKFISESDTEVILHSYYQWGKSCLNKFNGMWAFCIYDKKKKTLFLSRDRFGIKPLYYYYDKNKFIFASEIKAIKKHPLNLKINLKALNFYFYQKYIGGRLTIFKNIYKLEPGENLIFDLEKKTIKINKYYYLEKEIEKVRKIPLQERVELIESLIVDAVEKRLIADVPVGSFLSGGIDSSLVSAIIAQKKKNFQTFSIGFKEKSFDEVKFSKIASQHIKTRHHYQYLKKIDESLIEKVIGNLDEPFGDSSLLPTFLLSEITRKKVTVALSGDGGDETFAGYDTYKGYKIARYIPPALVVLSKYFINLLPPSSKKVSLTFKIKRFVSNFDSNIGKRHLNWLATFPEKERKTLLKNNFLKNSSFINSKSERGLLSLQLNDFDNYLPGDILKKVDIASMLNSLEVRVPFLDYRLVPLVLSLPENYKIKGLKTKYLLKKIALKYLPKKIAYRKKSGFTLPVSKWIKKSKLIKEYLLNEKYYRHGFLNRSYVLNLYNDHVNNKNDNSRKLWLVFVFNYWWSKK